MFLYDLISRDAEVDRLAELQSRIIDETDAVVHALPFPAGTLSQPLPLMLTIREEGREL